MDKETIRCLITSDANIIDMGYKQTNKQTNERTTVNIHRRDLQDKKNKTLKFDRQTDRQLDRRTDGRTDGRTGTKIDKQKMAKVYLQRNKGIQLIKHINKH